jgi:hypothetical protein
MIGSAALGAGLMYLFDPRQGHRRRALARDKAVHLLRTSGRAIDVTSRDASHRAYGVVSAARSYFRPGRPGDEVLVARVRSQLGRVSSHPRAIEVTAHDGRVTLHGPILVDEVDPLLSSVRRIKGVEFVENQLEPHTRREDIPNLQGGIPRQGGRFALMQEN